MMNLDLDDLAKVLQSDEGFRGSPYVDTTGNTTIGYGRNLTAKPLTQSEAAFLLSHDMADAMRDAMLFFQSDKPNIGFVFLDGVRQMVLVNMAFNLGLTKLREFRKFRAALERKDYAAAAGEMLDSTWAKQVGARAQRLSKEMRTGVAQ